MGGGGGGLALGFNENVELQWLLRTTAIATIFSFFLSIDENETTETCCKERKIGNI